MRTITDNLRNRILAQAEEADFQGFEKVAIKLKHQINSTPTRSDFEEYMYSENDLKNDVQDLLWTCTIRAQDYFGKTADAKELNELIERTAVELISSIRTKIGGDVIGPHEPLVPGEKRMIVEIQESE